MSRALSKEIVQNAAEAGIIKAGTSLSVLNNDDGKPLLFLVGIVSPSADETDSRCLEQRSKTAFLSPRRGLHPPLNPN